MGGWDVSMQERKCCSAHHCHGALGRGKPEHSFSGEAEQGRGGEQNRLCWLVWRPVGVRQGEQRAASAAPHCSEDSMGELPSPGVHLEGGCKSNLSARVH